MLHIQVTSIAKALIVLPLVLHEPTMKKLKGRSFKRSIEEFIIKHPECLITFNKRYEDFLPISVNSITILNAINVTRIEKEALLYNIGANFSPENSIKIGKRAKNIFQAIDSLNELIKDEETHSLYLKLKIQL
ncbi:hypothetical protein K4L44_03755 [Halosquirtibacter laminarini]|uniref:Uncharacterized protein n=1 Tax=Halosquirtibacter laminarini TaxID=3374600 RepID=A0AC61NH14_9BACT|nr:hypothetical protein K4L44_03755 [Prolixibacteraceae bacterium]